MSKQDEPSDQSRSLLRRLLKDPAQQPPADDPGGAPGDTPPEDAVRVPLPAPRRPSVPEGSPAVPTSPIRPTAPDESLPQEPLAPSLGDAPAPAALTPREQMQRAEEALILLREKMARIASEFAQGALNRAQFNAIYGHYSEQRDIIERLLTRNPNSTAWQTVARPGYTGLLHQQFKARVLSYAIYDQETALPITLTGTVHVAQPQVTAVIERLKAVISQRGNPGPASRKLDGERAVLFVPGETTTAVAIFSLEPSAAQVKRVEDIHHDFERANQYALRSRDYTAERLVFPHRALFEEKKA